MDEVYSPKLNAEIWHHLSKIPNYIAPSVMKVDYDRLFRQGVQHLVFDVDNTLVSFGEVRLDPSTRDFLLKLKARPEVKSLRLATNSIRNLTAIAESLDVPVIQPGLASFKPLPTYYHRVLSGIGAPPWTAAMIGDKLIQDVWGANFVGMTTVLVQPLGQDNLVDRFFHVRWHERHLLRKYLPAHIETWF